MNELFVRVEVVEKKIDERFKHYEKEQEELWSEVGKLKDNHQGHDRELLKIMMNIENMVKEMAQQRKELLQSISDNQETLKAHLKDEETDRRETIKAIRGLGWQVMMAVIGGGVTLVVTVLSKGV